MKTDLLKKINRTYFPGKLFYDPDCVVLGVNNVCNLHCKMCDVGTEYQPSNFYHHLMESRPVNMPLDLIKKIIDQTAEYFPQTKIGYAFTEPLIYPHLAESLEYAHSKNIYTTMTTNGLGLEKKADELRDAGLDEIFVSLDGPPDVHNQIRGNQRSFESAFAGMERIIEYSGMKPRISVYCTITEWNTGRLAEFAELFRHIPLKELGFMHTNYTTEAMANAHNAKFGDTYPAAPSSMEQLNFDNMDFEELRDEISKVKVSDYPFRVFFSPELTSKDELVNFYFAPENFIGKICNDSFRNVMVKSDGTVIPSHGRCYRVEAGNIYQQSLKDIWNGEPLSAFRKTLMREGGLLPACSRCCSAF